MEMLNGRGVLGEHGRPWTRATVHQVLTNPKYIGANIYNRRSFKLKHKRVKNPVADVDLARRSIRTDRHSQVV